MHYPTFSKLNEEFVLKYPLITAIGFKKNISRLEIKVSPKKKGKLPLQEKTSP